MQHLRSTAHSVRNMIGSTSHQVQVVLSSCARHEDAVAMLQATFEDKNFVHIVMELCVGGELFDSIVESGSYTEAKAAACFRKMVDMLHHCHELGVMHRDLKPENFLLTSKNKEKCALARSQNAVSVPPCTGCPTKQLPACCTVCAFAPLQHPITSTRQHAAAARHASPLLR